MKYHVWIPDCEDVDDSKEREADSPEEAARQEADYDHRHNDAYEWTWPVTYHVRDDAGHTWTVEVDRDYHPVFYAARAQAVTP